MCIFHIAILSPFWYTDIHYTGLKELYSSVHKYFHGTEILYALQHKSKKNAQGEAYAGQKSTHNIESRSVTGHHAPVHTLRRREDKENTEANSVAP